MRSMFKHTKTKISFNQTTPVEMNSSLKNFIKKTIKHHDTPVFLSFTHISDKYLNKYCHSNCEAEYIINKHPIVFGWIVWEDKHKKFIESEFHAVIKINNSLTDITPRKDGEEYVLFVPDKEKKATRINKRTWETWTNFKSINGIICEKSVKKKLRNLFSNKWV